MNHLVEKIAELVFAVNNGDIDTLGDLHRELIHLAAGSHLRYLVAPPGSSPFFWAEFDQTEPHSDDLVVYDLEAGLFTNDGGQNWAAIEK